VSCCAAGLLSAAQARCSTLASSANRVCASAGVRSPNQSSTPELVRQVVRALKPTGTQILVAATTHDLADPANGQVMVTGVLPSHLVMGDVDLAVIAGGQGSVQTALAAGVPFVGIPLQSEQDANVTFAQNQGAARLIAQKPPGRRR
jgi:UDP:flavonoid glycosyltransferase YjiC (YdhE family)